MSLRILKILKRMKLFSRKKITVQKTSRKKKHPEMNQRKRPYPETIWRMKAYLEMIWKKLNRALIRNRNSLPICLKNISLLLHSEWKRKCWQVKWETSMKKMKVCCTLKARLWWQQIRRMKLK